MAKIIDEFKEFAVKGNVVEMGVGIVIGAAFTSVVNSLVKDIFNPLLNLVVSDINFNNLFWVLQSGKNGGPYTSIAEAQADQAITLNFGLLLNATISFLIVSIVLFFVIRGLNKLKRPERVTDDPVKTRECPYCYSNISQKATRCPQCTSDLENER